MHCITDLCMYTCIEHDVIACRILYFGNIVSIHALVSILPSLWMTIL